MLSKILGVLLLIGTGTYGYHMFRKSQAELARFHQNFFNSQNASIKYSVSPSKLALIIHTRIKSGPHTDKRLNDIPLFKQPISYKMTHFLTLSGHSGILEITKHDNPAISDFISQDVRMNFVILNDQEFSFDSGPVQYKIKDFEINFGKSSGVISLNNQTSLKLDKLKIRNQKIHAELTDIQLNGSKTENSLAIKAQKMLLNKVVVNSPEFSIKGKNKVDMIFKGFHQKNPIDIVFQTEKIKISEKEHMIKYGRMTVPASYVDENFNPMLDKMFKEQEESLSKIDNKKTKRRFQILKDVLKKDLKNKMLFGMIDPRFIKKKNDFYIYERTRTDLIEEKSILEQHLTEKQAILEEWKKLEQDKMINEALFALIFGNENYTSAAGDLVNELEKDISHEPLFQCLRTRAILNGERITTHNDQEDRIIFARNKIAELEQSIPDHKCLTLLKLKVGIETNNSLLKQEMYTKFRYQETNPKLRLLFQTIQIMDKDDKKALEFLESANNIKTDNYLSHFYQREKHHLLSHVDEAEYETLSNSLLENPKTPVSVRTHYAKHLIERKRIDEALPLLEACLKTASPQSECRTLYLKSYASQILSKNPDEGLSEVSDLLELHPTNKDLLSSLGDLHFQKGQFDEAIKAQSITCMLGDSLSCIKAGDNYRSKKNNPTEALAMYESGCDLKASNGCLRAGLMAEETGKPEIALNYFTTTCEMKDGKGCYQLARMLQKNNRSKEEVVKHLQRACKEIPNACKLATSIWNGKKDPIPVNP